MKKTISFLGLFLFIGGCSDDTHTIEPNVETYDAELRRTQNNVVHILAENLEGIGFGQGYAGAQDGICVLADQILKVRGQRAKYFGTGGSNEHVMSDLFYVSRDLIAESAEQFELLTSNTQKLIKGYAAGYNQYLLNTESEQLPSACKRAEWVEPITHIDLFAYYLDLASVLGARNFVFPIASAQPPSAEAAITLSVDSTALPNFKRFYAGSNGLALGKLKTSHGRGMLLANPHLPWLGEFTYTEQHLTIPGSLNAAGVQILGVPMLGIGFNQHSAQTVTVSSASQFTAYRLQLEEGNPLGYVYGDEVIPLTSKDVTIDVLDNDGTLSQITQTLYSSHYGPIFELPVIGEWNDSSALTIRFPENLGKLFDSYIQTLLTETNDEFLELLNENGGSPFLNYLRVEEGGEVFYIDAAPVPNLSEESLSSFYQALENDPITDYLFSQFGLIVLDGSSPTNEWVNSELQALPGITPIENAPQYRGSDYVVHNNDSPWMVNATSPVTGFSPLYGSVGTPRQPRQRVAHILLNEIPGDDGLFDFGDLFDLQFANKGLIATLIKDDLANYCLIEPSYILDGEEVDLREACELLLNWDGTYNLASVGVPIFREYINQFTAADIVSGEGLFKFPFDIENPLTTPSGLLIEGERRNNHHLEKLARAVKLLATTNIALSAPLKDWQYSSLSERETPVHGGSGSHEGVWNLVEYSTQLVSSLVHYPAGREFLTPDNRLGRSGYPINTGTSFVMAVSFEQDNPTAKGLLTYGQSKDLESEFFGDQMTLFSQKSLRPIHFLQDDVEANTTTTEIVTAVKNN